MTNKNNLDKLFQKQLTNLEATPNKRVWNNIEAKLKKKKTKVFPFWWFSGAVAAVLILGLLFFPFSEEKDTLKKINSTVIKTVPRENIHPEKKIQKQIDSFILEKKINQKILVADDDTNSNKKENNKTQKLINNKKEVFVAIKNNNKTKNERESISIKNTTENILLADYSGEIIVDSINTKLTLITKKDIKKIDKETETTPKEVHNLEQTAIANKTDLNVFIAKQDSLKIKELVKNRWAVAPVFGVLNSNSFTNTSPINSNLSNSTKGRNTISYGLQVAYKINKKWAIKSGVHLQEMSYANSQVALTSVISANSSSVVFNTGNSLATEESAQTSDLEINSFGNKTIPNNNLTQNYGYVEVPVEIKYNLSNNRKLETELVAGFSSLFLNKNEILISNNFSSQSGEATNLNTINFSGNLGVDFNYFIDKNWSINVNPMFKAQLNTFNNNANGFSPFNIGLYSGVKYQF